MKFRTETLKPIRVAGIRGVGPYSQVLPHLWKQLMTCANERKLLGPGMQMITVVWDDPRVTPADRLRSDASFTVADSFEATDLLTVQTLPGGRFLVGIYVGPYSGLPGAWKEFIQKISATAFRDGPCYEIYRSNPNNTPEDQLVTELYAPAE